MSVFYLRARELYVLLHQIDPYRYFIDSFLGFLGAPEPDPQLNTKIVPEIYSAIVERNDQSEAFLRDFLHIFDIADIAIYGKIVRPQEKYPPCDFDNYPQFLRNSGVLNYLPPCRIIRSITGRSGQINFSVIRDEDTYLFILEDTQYGNLRQIQELLYHSLGEKPELMLDPLNIPYQQSLEFAKHETISQDCELSPRDILRINELLAAEIEQKATLIIEAKSFTQTYASPIALGIIDFTDLGRIISKPYASFDSSKWIKYLSGTEYELEKALAESITAIGVNWFAHQR